MDRYCVKDTRHHSQGILRERSRRRATYRSEICLKISTEQFEIIKRKVGQLEKLTDFAHSKSYGSSNDILALAHFCMSLETQIRQLRADFDTKVSTEEPEKK